MGLRRLFAIGCMLTELDISSLDAVRTRACKKINGLPFCTTSAMIHEDLDQAGLGMSSLMITYADSSEVSCKYLVQALNDKGPLGFTTQHLLLLQDKATHVALKHPGRHQTYFSA